LVAVFFFTCVGLHHFFKGRLHGVPTWVWGFVSLIAAAVAFGVVEFEETKHALLDLKLRQRD